MATSQLGLHGPQRPYGTFAPKSPGTPPASPAAVLTHLGLHGSQRRYETFAPKTPPPGFTPAPVLTSLGLHGSQRAYAVFVAKGAGGGGGGTLAFYIFGDTVVS